MPKSSRKRTRRQGASSRVLRTLAVTLGLVAVAGIAGLKWTETTAGRLFLAEQGVAPAGDWLRDRVEDALWTGLAAAGIDSASVAVTPGTQGGPQTLRTTCAQPLLDLNILLTHHVVEAGGTVRHGERHEENGSATLELRVGTPQEFTHRVLVHRGNQTVQPPPLPQGRLALVIDDWGHNLGPAARRILALDLPITVAILPELSQSRRILTEARRRGKPALLHLPMEPEAAGEIPADDPAIRVGMEALEIRALTARLLDGLDGVEGVNNHMGSKATRFRPEMEACLSVLAERGLLFLDSVTSPHSVAYDVAREQGIPALRNDLFLDVDTQDPAVVEARLRRLVDLARERGEAIGIGHVNEATAAALERVLPGLDPADVRVVGLADLVREPAR